MSLTFIVNGREMSADQVKASAAPAKKAAPRESLKATTDRSVAKVSMGFIVTGYSPQHWAARIAAHQIALKLYAEDPTKNKNPGTLDEFTLRWMAKNKPGRARSKPYEIEAAADQCAELMRKAGWLHVNVEELMKG